jgi:hypothetical protein
MVVDFGKEDTTYIGTHELKSMLISHYRGITRFAKSVFFNDEHIDNHTIRYIADDPKHIHIVENNVYRAVPKEYVLDTMIINSWQKLVEFFKKLETEGKIELFKASLVSEETFTRIQDFVADFEKLCQGYTPLMLADIRNDVFDMIKFQTIEQDKKLEKKKKRSTKQHAS